MNNWEDIQTELLELSNRILEQCHPVSPEDLGLDRRAGYQLYLGLDFIAVTRAHAGQLDYYGGFEYVDKENRMEVGDLVLYSTMDNRVQNHFDRCNEDPDHS